MSSVLLFNFILKVFFAHRNSMFKSILKLLDIFTEKSFASSHFIKFFIVTVWCEAVWWQTVLGEKIENITNCNRTRMKIRMIKKVHYTNLHERQLISVCGKFIPDFLLNATINTVVVDDHQNYW